MSIKVMNLTDVPTLVLSDYIKQIARWYHQEWGAITKQSEDDFERIIKKNLREKLVNYFVAVNSENNELLGTLSLKIRNMEDEYPDHRWGPWLSGLYVAELHRKQKISAMLCAAVTAFAIKNNIFKIYFFTHNFALNDFYQRLEPERIQPAFEKNYKYRDKPILVFTVSPAKLNNLLVNYLKQAQKEFSSTQEEKKCKL